MIDPPPAFSRQAQSHGPEMERLAFFLPSLDAGGAERVLLALAGEIGSRGYRCDLLAARAGGAWEHNVPDHVRYLPLGAAKPLLATARLARYLRQERPSAILSTVFPANVACLLAHRLARTNVRCVVREANRTLDDIQSSSPWTALGNRIALRWLYPKADAIVALTDGLAQHLAGLVPLSRQNVAVISNPCIPSRATATTTLPTVSPDDPPLVLACGRLEPQKDFVTLLEAFAIVRRHKSARMLILGTGSQLPSLIAHARSLGIGPDVEFAGYADDPRAWMKRSKVFVSSSRWEGFPNVLMEALDCGCPVVATRSSDAVTDIMADGTYGDVVPVGDPAAMARSIAEILAGRRFPDARDHLQRYDLRRIADRYLEVLIGSALRARDEV